MRSIIIAACVSLFLPGSSNSGKLDAKLPVVVTINECPQKAAFSLILSEKLRERKFTIIDESQARELLNDAAVTQSQRDSYKMSSKTDPVAYAKRTIATMPYVAQRLLVNLTPGKDKRVDSCYYAIRFIPAHEVSSSRTFVVDSVAKGNDLDLLARTILEATTKSSKEK